MTKLETEELDRFRKAVHLIDTGNVTELDALLTQHPELLRARCYVGEWYEAGYFKGAALLNHIAGNPIRHPLPPNIADETRLLLAHGADPDLATDEGWPTVGLLLTGRQVSESQVGVTLIDILVDAGAQFDMADPNLLSMPLMNCAPETAAELAKRGANVDIRHAAGLGWIGDLTRLLGALPGDRDNTALIEEAVLFAAVRNQPDAVRELIKHGARGDRLIARPDGSRSALHEAANRGHREVVELLLAADADPGVVETIYGGTPAGWAEHGGHAEIAALLRAEAAKRVPCAQP